MNLNLTKLFSLWWQSGRKTQVKKRTKVLTKGQESPTKILRERKASWLKLIPELPHLVTLVLTRRWNLCHIGKQHSEPFTNKMIPTKYFSKLIQNGTLFVPIMILRMKLMVIREPLLSWLRTWQTF